MCGTHNKCIAASLQLYDLIKALGSPYIVVRILHIGTFSFAPLTGRKAIPMKETAHHHGIVIFGRSGHPSNFSMSLIVAFELEIGRNNKISFQFIVEITVFIPLAPNIVPGTFYGVG